MILTVILLIVWVLGLLLFSRTQTHFFKFFFGSVGLFFFLLVLGNTFFTHLILTVTSYPLWIIGQITHLYKTYISAATITVFSGVNTLSFYISHECSGIIETLVYISLLLFYPLYNLKDKIKYLLMGIIYIIAINVLRIFLICLVVHFLGISTFFFVHIILAKLIFFSFMVGLYYYVFTRPHVLRQKVGD